MSFIKQTLKNTASLVLAAWIIGTAYAAITTVNSGDPLTASSWNEMVTRLTNTDTNSTDLVTKSYVDSTVSASSGWAWSNCEWVIMNNIWASQTITCPLWKTIRSHSFTCTPQDNATGFCHVTSLTSTSLTGYWNTTATNWYRYPLSASILCCNE